MTGDRWTALVGMLWGLVLFLGSVFDWSLLMESRKARLTTKIIGSFGTRMFYTVIGAGMFAVCLLFLIGAKR